MKRPPDSIITSFNICLERMRRGESIDVCLRDFPGEAAELEPLLVAARHVRAVPPPELNPEARQVIRRRIHSAVAARQKVPRRMPKNWLGPFVLRFALALIVALLTLGSGVAAAQRSLPSNVLYPLKRASENIRLQLASSPAERAALQLDFATSRTIEIIALTNSGQAVDNTLVNDLEQAYTLAWQEIGQAQTGEARVLTSRYVSERQADVQQLSAALAHARVAAKPQLQRAVQLGTQALTEVAPGQEPVPSPVKEPHTGNGPPSSDGESDSSDSPKPNGGQSGVNQEPKGSSPDSQATPEGKPADAGPQATPEGKPADAGPQATPEGKPAAPGPNREPKPKPKKP